MIKKTPQRSALYLSVLCTAALAACSNGSSTSSSDNSNEEGTDMSTAGIECDYNEEFFNGSASVNATSSSAWTCLEATRELEANGIPDHETGTFPNAGNPNSISEQAVSASYTLTPEQATMSTELGGPSGPTGFMLNGIKIDASTGGSCDDSGESCDLGDNSGGWNIEALSQSSFDFGADDNNAHVQPDGSYHYHGLPVGLVEKLGGTSETMTLIGWAADGFPIYDQYGYSVAMDSSSAIKAMAGSYQYVSDVPSNRPSTDIYPLGTFKQDWEYVEGAGDLDACNGRVGVTPEFPDGIYHYYATTTYPFLQRCVGGVVDAVGGPPAAGGMPPQ